MSSVQVPAYTTASTITPIETPLSYEVVPNTATILPLATNGPLVSTRKGKNASLKKELSSVTPIASVPIVATEAGPVYQIELNKRLLDGQRELKEKQADMEADKEKKLEEKADKHRTKAVKWIGRGYPGMAARHERSATKLDVEANKHYMMAEQLRSQAKAIDRERKAFDPPKEEKKKTVAKGAAMRRPATAGAPSSSSSSSSGAPPAQRSTSVTSTSQPAPGAPQQRSVEKKEVVEQKPLAQPSLQKEEVQPSLKKEEPVVSRTEEVAPAPAGDEVKTTERKVEENPDGEKKVEKKEEKHHHMLPHHHENAAGTSSH